MSHSHGSFTDEEGSVSDEDENAGTPSNVSDAGSDNEAAAPRATDATSSNEKKADEPEAAPLGGDEGPDSHDKTECDCGKEGHYDKVICDEVVKGPMGKIWNRVFGQDKEFMMGFLRDNQKLQGRIIIKLAS